MTGRVVSIKLKNTATVLVSRVAKHPLYKKTYVQTKRYLVDDQVGVKMGDIVDIINCKPISKNKHWKITKVLGRSFKELAEEHLKEKSKQAIAEVMPEEPASTKVSAGKEEKVEEVKKVEKGKKVKKEKK